MKANYSFCFNMNICYFLKELEDASNRFENLKHH